MKRFALLFTAANCLFVYLSQNLAVVPVIPKHDSLVTNLLQGRYTTPPA